MVSKASKKISNKSRKRKQAARGRTGRKEHLEELVFAAHGLVHARGELGREAAAVGPGERVEVHVRHLAPWGRGGTAIPRGERTMRAVERVIASE